MYVEKFLVCLCLCSVVQCARILGIFPVGGKSHYSAGLTLMTLLANNGHEVTMVSPFSTKNLPKNFKEVPLIVKEEMKVDFFSFNAHPLLQNFIYNMIGPQFINATLSHPDFKKFLSTGEKYDLIILEQFYTDGLKYLGMHFKAPLILYSALDANFWTNPTVANPAPPSYIPSLSTPFSGQMSFFERMENSIVYLGDELVRNFWTLPIHDKIIKEHFPGAPDIAEYFSIPAITFLNGDISVNDPVPKVPSMVDIGGFHIKPTKPLPEDLQTILDQAKYGAIYFSLGSNIKSADMPTETIKALLKVFSTLKQTVLWKWEDEKLAGKPDNVITRKWFPQNDILAHKNVKIFITHGGIFSTLEATYHGVPSLAFPIYGDQTMNAKRATSNGYARWIDFRQINEKNLKEEIEELLTNKRYSENIKKRSLLLRDKPVKPADKLLFWVEYVLRHKGAEHLRVSAFKLNWFQYLLLDVIAFILISLLVVFILVKYLLNSLIKVLCKSGSKLKSQ